MSGSSHKIDRTIPESIDRLFQQLEVAALSQPRGLASSETNANINTARNENSQVPTYDLGSGSESLAPINVMYHENMANEPPKEVLEDYSSETEDEVEMVGLLKTKASAEMTAGNYDSGIRVLHKACHRLEKLKERRPAFENAAFDTSLEVATVFMKLKRFEQASELLEKLDASHIGKQNLQLSMMRVEVFLRLNQLETAQIICWRALRDARRLYGRKDPRYYETLALKIQILQLQGERDDAEALLTTLPEQYHAGAEVSKYVAGQSADVLIGHEIPLDGEYIEEKIAVDQEGGATNRNSAEEPPKQTLWKALLKEWWTIAAIGTPEQAVQLQNRGVYSEQVGRDADDLTLLAVATIRGNIAMVFFFIDTHMPIDEIFSPYKFTALHAAIQLNQTKAAEVLIGRGASLSLRTMWNYTPLHLAVAAKNLRIVKILLDYGASGTDMNEDREKPALQAWKLGYIDIFEMIVQKTGAVY